MPQPKDQAKVLEHLQEIILEAADGYSSARDGSYGDVYLNIVGIEDLVIELKNMWGEE